eukprot:SAG31_NODE_3492_length_4201_cov_3.139444_3_plen_92_part_00
MSSPVSDFVSLFFLSNEVLTVHQCCRSAVYSHSGGGDEATAYAQEWQSRRDNIINMLNVSDECKAAIYNNLDSKSIMQTVSRSKEWDPNVL